MCHVDDGQEIVDWKRQQKYPLLERTETANVRKNVIKVFNGHFFRITYLRGFSEEERRNDEKTRLITYSSCDIMPCMRWLLLRNQDLNRFFHILGMDREGIYLFLKAD